jgi:hypothetical protein
VRVEEPQRLSATMFRYPVEIEVPVGSPTANFTAARVGQVVLKTDHPGNPEVKFSVSLVVGQ